MVECPAAQQERKCSVFFVITSTIDNNQALPMLVASHTRQSRSTKLSFAKANVGVTPVLTCYQNP